MVAMSGFRDRMRAMITGRRAAKKSAEAVEEHV
jgi:hypothetical protein